MYNAENSQMSSAHDSDQDDDFVQTEHSSSDSDSSEGNLEPDNHFGMNNEEFQTAIASFCVNSKLTGQQTNDLLDFLRHAGHQLPKDYGTLRQTPRTVETQEKCGGNYIYFGLERVLCYQLAGVHNVPDVLQLRVFTDGLSISDSSSECIWPLLCAFPWSKPFEIALWSGMAKPNSVEEFLADFIAEYQVLNTQGMMINGKQIQVAIQFFICDAPARQFLKKIKGHGGYHACEKCKVRGFRSHNRTCFEPVEMEKRTD